MKAIVAVDLDWGIGYKGELLQRIPEDMKFFKENTLNKVVIMGRQTFESLPGMEPLKDRENIVLSKDMSFAKENVIVCRSLDELFLELKKYSKDDIYVIGGESIYTQLLPFCSEALVTKINKAYTADKFFVNLDEDANWKHVNAGEKKLYKDIEFCFNRYVKVDECNNK